MEDLPPSIKYFIDGHMTYRRRVSDNQAVKITSYVSLFECMSENM